MITPDDICLYCGRDQSETRLVLVGHGGGEPMCEDECLPVYNHPRPRQYRQLTDDLLDRLEYEADVEMHVIVEDSVIYSLLRELKDLRRELADRHVELTDLKHWAANQMRQNFEQSLLMPIDAGAQALAEADALLARCKKNNEA